MSTASASRDGRRLRVDRPSGQIDAAAIWIRDACHCASCRRPSTNERLLDSTMIDRSIAIRSAIVAAGTLRATTSDGHEVVVPIGHLDLLAGVGSPRYETSTVPDDIGTVEPPVVEQIPRSAIATDLDEVVAHLARDGAIVVDGLDPSAAGVHDLASAIAPIEPTNYGTTWSIDAVLDPVSEVESNRPLLVHTDLPYRSEPPAVQVLLAARVDVDGGETTLVDGVAAARRLAAADPIAFELLTRVPFEFPYLRPDVEIVGRAPLIELDERGDVRVIRRAPDLVGSPAVHPDDVEPLYAALGVWSDLLDDPAATATVALAPGQAIVFDNHRMLHGRTAFDLGTSGRRILHGCYLRRIDAADRRAMVAR